VDASVNIGTGHVMRCLTLAEELKDNGAELLFICRELPGHMADVIRKQGFAVDLLPLPEKQEKIPGDESSPNAKWQGVHWEQDAEQTHRVLENKKWNWLVIDHYGIDERWERNQRDTVDKILVIDDLANRIHDCDVLLDQNLYESMRKRYDGLLPDKCRLLLGPEYSMLRKEFFEARGKIKQNKKIGRVSRVLVFFGGSDPTGETEKVLQAILLLDHSEIIFDVVVGNSNANKHIIESKCADMQNVNFYCQIENISELMLKADLAIGAAGSASWERCFLGLPSIIVITADNQKEVAEKTTKEQAVINLGTSINVCVDDFLNLLERLIRHPDELQAMSENSFRLMPDNKLKAEISALMKGSC